MSQPTVVLVHGAFADASSFGDVIPQLLDDRHPRSSPRPCPNRSLNGDAAYVGAVLASIPGPVVLVGHSYGCAVATVAGTADNVTSLVYLAGFVPDQGESLGELAARFPESDLGQRPGPDAGPGWRGPHRRRRPVPRRLRRRRRPGRSPAPWPSASDRSRRPRSRRRQRRPPGTPSRPGASSPTADHTINPDVQRFGYQRANVAALEVESSHLVMLSQPSVAVELIKKAVLAVSD